MITEQKLNEIGKEKYISFVELIMGLLERKDFRNSLPVAPTLPRLNLNIIKSPEDLERFVKFTPTKETPSTLKIPGSVIEKIIGEKHIEERGCLIEVRNCLIDDAVLKRFVDPSGDDTDYSKGFFVPNALYAINKGRHKEMRWEEFDMVVSPCMTVSEIKQYIKDVLSLGVPKPESATNTKKLRLEFDEEIGILSFGKNQYSFHLGRQQSREKNRLALMKKLWPKRRRVSGGGRHEEKLPKPALAFDLKLCKSEREYNDSEGVRGKLNDLIKGINRSMKDNGIPAKISSDGGVQLIELK